MATAGLLLLLSCAAPTPAPISTEEADASNRRRLAMAGFEPLEALSVRGVEVQRVDLIWGLIDYPAVELRRDASGVVTISINYWGHKRTATVADAVWQQLAARIDESFVEPNPREARRRDRRVTRRGGFCHYWQELEASVGGQLQRFTATPCYGDLHATSLAYAEALARAAIDHIDMCEPDRNIPDTPEALYACGRRFGPPTSEHRLIVDPPAPSTPKPVD